jgi:hypothetical protein
MHDHSEALSGKRPSRRPSRKRVPAEPLLEASSSRLSEALALARRVAANYDQFSMALSLDPVQREQIDRMTAGIRIEMAKAGIAAQALRLTLTDTEAEAKSREEVAKIIEGKRTVAEPRPVVLAKDQEEFDREFRFWFWESIKDRLDDVRFHEFMRLNCPDKLDSHLEPSRRHDMEPHDVAMRSLSKAAGAAELGFTELSRICFAHAMRYIEKEPDAWKRLYFKAMIGMDMAKYHMREEAISAFEAVLGSELLAKPFPVEMFLDGVKKAIMDEDWPRHPETQEETFVRSQTIELLAGIAVGYSQLGERNLSNQIGARAVKTRTNAAPMATKLYWDEIIIRRLAEAGNFDQARVFASNNMFISSKATATVGIETAKRTDKGADPEKIDKDALFSAAAGFDEETALYLGKVLSLDEIVLFCGGITAKGKREDIFWIMAGARMSLYQLFDVMGEEKSNAIPPGITDDNGGRLLNICKALINETESGADRTASYPHALRCLGHLARAGSRSAKDVLLRHVNAMQSAHRTLLIHAEVLAGLEPQRTTGILMGLLVEDTLSSFEKMKILLLLTEEGHLPDDILHHVIIKLKDVPQDSKGRYMDFYLSAMRLVITELHIAPSATLMDIIISDSSDILGVRKNLESLKDEKVQFDYLLGSKAILSLLASSRRTATSYYALNRNNTAYHCGNPFDPDKFVYLVRRIRAFDVSEEVVRDFISLLPQDQRETISLFHPKSLKILLDGAFPHYGSPTRNVAFPSESGESGQDIILRCLDQGTELVESVRAADSVPDCLDSMGWECMDWAEESRWSPNRDPHSAADVVALANADPLTLIVQIERPSEKAPREAIGFVYVHMGECDGKLAVFLDSVYLQDGDGRAKQTVIDAIEEWISRPLGASYQFVSTKYGSFTPSSDYSNAPRTVKLFNAVKYKGEVLQKTRNDIDVGGCGLANQPGSTGPEVWCKRLI